MSAPPTYKEYLTESGINLACLSVDDRGIWRDRYDTYLGTLRDRSAQATERPKQKFYDFGPFFIDSKPVEVIGKFYTSPADNNKFLCKGKTSHCGHDTFVAIKKSSPEEVNHEREMLQRLHDHGKQNPLLLKGWPELYCSGPNFLIIEFIGQDLRSLPKNNEISFNIMSKLVGALKSIHDDIAIVHGDIKPANILWDCSNGITVVKLCDFDSATVEGALFPASDDGIRLKYTPMYESPELSNGKIGLTKSSLAMDIFSTGLVLYEIINKTSTPLLPRDDRDRKNLYSNNALLQDRMTFPQGLYEDISTNIRELCHVDIYQRKNLDLISSKLLSATSRERQAVKAAVAASDAEWKKRESIGIQNFNKRLDAIETSLSQLKAGLDKLALNTREILIKNSELNNLVQSVIRGSGTCPSLFVFVPVVATTWISKANPLNFIRDKYRLFFLCSHNKRIVNCGPDGKGYEITCNREWIVKAAPFIKLGLLVLKEVLGTFHVPLPIAPFLNILENNFAIHSAFIDSSLKFVADQCTVAQASATVLDNALDHVDYRTGHFSKGDIVASIGTAEEEMIARESITNILTRCGYFSSLRQTCGLTLVDHRGIVAWVENVSSVIADFKRCCDERIDQEQQHTTSVPVSTPSSSAAPAPTYSSQLEEQRAALASGSVSACKTAGCSVEQVVRAGFSGANVRDAGYTVDDVRWAGYKLEDLRRTFGFTAYEIKSCLYGKYTAADLKDAGFSASELKAAGYSASDMKTAKVSAGELMIALFKTKDMWSAGYTAAEMQIAGYSVAELKTAGYTVNQFFASSYSASELSTNGYTAGDLKAGGYFIQQLVVAGYNRSALLSAGFSHDELRRAGCTEAIAVSTPPPILLDRDEGAVRRASVLKRGGKNASQLRAQGFSANSLAAVFFSASDMKSAGFSAQELKMVGYSVHQLRNACYKPSDVITAGYTTTQLRDANYSIEQFRSAGIAAADLKVAGYSLIDLSNGGFKPEHIIGAGYELIELQSAGYTAAQLCAGNYSPTTLFDAGFKISELRAAGYSPVFLAGISEQRQVQAYRAGGYTALELRHRYPVERLIANGYSISDMRAGGYSAAELCAVNVLPNVMLSAGYTLTELYSGGYRWSEALENCFCAAVDLRNAGFCLFEFSHRYTAADLRCAGYTAEELWVACYTVRECMTAGYTMSQMKAAGYSDNELLTGGYAFGDDMRVESPLTDSKCTCIVS